MKRKDAAVFRDFVSNQRIFIVGDKLVVSYDTSWMTPDKKHHEQTARLADLDASTIDFEFYDDFTRVFVRCAGEKQCVRKTVDGKEEEWYEKFNVGNVGVGDGHDVQDDLRRLLTRSIFKPGT